MTDGLLRFLMQLRTPGQIVREVVDVLLVAYVIYRALLVVRGTRAMQIGTGMAVAAGFYFVAKAAGLATFVNLLSGLLSNIALVAIVVFQNDIRRALMRVGQSAWSAGGRDPEAKVIDEIIAATTELARHRTGALIAIEKEANVLEFAKNEGVVLDAAVTRELLVALFVPEQENKLHDGAVLVRDLRVARAGVFFPMPEARSLDRSFGSRHRAALGITEETDCVVIAVSEERGTITGFFKGNYIPNLDADSLRSWLEAELGKRAKKALAKAEKAERADRADKADKAERADRADKAERADRADKADKAERADKADKAERADKADKAERADRAEKAERADRAEKAERADRADKADKAERADRADKADKAERERLHEKAAKSDRLERERAEAKAERGEPSDRLTERAERGSDKPERDFVRRSISTPMRPSTPPSGSPRVELPELPTLEVVEDDEPPRSRVDPHARHTSMPMPEAKRISGEVAPSEDP